MDYDAFVIGTGFGGSVAMTRLATDERGTWYLTPQELLDNSKHFRVGVPLSGQTDVALRSIDCTCDNPPEYVDAHELPRAAVLPAATEGNTVVREEAAVFPVNSDLMRVFRCRAILPRPIRSRAVPWTPATAKRRRR